jgi:hypothetical protein
LSLSQFSQPQRALLAGAERGPGHGGDAAGGCESVGGKEVANLGQGGGRDVFVAAAAFQEHPRDAEGRELFEDPGAVLGRGEVPEDVAGGGVDAHTE